MPYSQRQFTQIMRHPLKFFKGFDNFPPKKPIKIHKESTLWTEWLFTTISPLAFNQPARAPIKGNGCTVACRSNYCAHVWLCIMISQGGARESLQVTIPRLNNFHGVKRKTAEASGKLHVLWKKKKKHYILVTDNEITPLSSTPTTYNTLSLITKSNSSTKITPFKCSSSPVWQKERADVGHWWSGGPELGQSHDVLKGDVCLRADVGNARVRRHPNVAVRRHGGRRRAPQDLDHDWLPPHGLHHRFFMFHFGEVTCIHLMREDITWSTSGVLTVTSANKWRVWKEEAESDDWLIWWSSHCPFLTGSYTLALFRNNPFHIHTWKACCP